MDITGKVHKVMPEQSGESQRGRWVKQEFVIEFEDGQFPRKACFTLFGDEKVAMVKQLALGDTVKVTFNIDSREFNERWFTNLNCWRIEKIVSQAIGGGYAGAQPQTAASNPATPVYNTMPSEPFESTLQPDDDLPF